VKWTSRLSLDAFAGLQGEERRSCSTVFVRECEPPGGCVMTYNYEQISQYLPTSVSLPPYRYLDG
jgi:hypothetical protein